MLSCSSCARPNPSDAAFCAGCGQKLGRVCARCERENDADANFCNGCGEPFGEDAAAADVSLARPSHRVGASEPAGPQPTSALRADLQDEVPATLAAGRYQLQRFLGEGAKKRVYLARDTRLDRDVAIAFIKSAGLDLVRVRREADRHPRVSHR